MKQERCAYGFWFLPVEVTHVAEHCEFAGGKDGNLEDVAVRSSARRWRAE